MWRMRQKGKGYQTHNSSLTPGARGKAGPLQAAGLLSRPSHWSLPLVQGTFESRRYHQCRVTKYLITLIP